MKIPAGTPKQSSARAHVIVRYAWILAAVWTVILAGLVAWNVLRVHGVTRELARTEAQAHFDEDQAVRFWAASHGGVYVPIDTRTPPNPYLDHLEERDIETPAGVELTLMNPAYILRQMNEEFAELYGVAGHITSLDPLRPENAADEWETEALRAFEQGETEVFEFTSIGSEPYLRMMEPMMTQESCLKCHAHQGYEVGDVRGGVSLAVPMAPYLARERRMTTAQSLSFGVLWLAGVGGIWLGSSRLTRRVREQEQAEERFRIVFDSVHDGIVLVDAKNNGFHLANPAMCELLGYTQGEFLQMGAEEIYPEEGLPYVREQYETQVAGAGQLASDVPVRRKDGSVFVADVSSAPTTLADKNYVIRVFRDVTARKEVEERLRAALDGTVQALGQTTETRDPYTASHQRRVTQLASAMAEGMRLKPEQIAAVRTAGLLHDIGKLTIPAEILSKPSQLTETEFLLIKGHPQAAYEILKAIEFPWPLPNIVLQHHERLDGSGYPQGLKGSETRVEAKILAVADVVEAMASHRPYRPALGIAKALEEISNGRGIRYDSGAVDTCLDLFTNQAFEFLPTQMNS